MKLSEDEMPLFLETNLGTRFAVSVPPDVTVCLLKGKLAVEHLSCFPNFGEIRVQKLMVKRKSCLYHLPDSIAVKYAFHNLTGSRFLHMEISNVLPLKESSVPPKTQQNALQGTLAQGVSLNATLDISPAFKKLNSCQFPSCKDKSKEFVTSQGLLTETRELVSVISNGAEYSRSRTSFSGTNQDGNSGRGQNVYDEDQKEVLFSPLSSQRRRKFQEDNCNKKAISGNLEETVVKETRVQELVPVSNLRKNKQNKNNIVDKFQPVAENDSKQLLKDKRSGRFRYPSVTETRSIYLPEESKETTVTGIISRYFSELDEVNSCGGEHRNEINTMKLSTQADESSNVLGSSSIQESTNRMKRLKCKMQLSFDAISSNAEVSGKSCVDKNALDVPRKRKISGKVLTTHKLKHYHTDRGFALKTNASIAVDLTTGKVAKRNTTISTPNIISHHHLYLERHANALHSKNDRNEVGKRLIQAANNIRDCAGRKKTPLSMFNLRCGGILSGHSTIPVRHLAFEIDNSDG